MGQQQKIFDSSFNTSIWVSNEYEQQVLIPAATARALVKVLVNPSRRMATACRLVVQG